MVINGNEMIVSSSYFNNNVEKELLYKLDLSTLSTSEFLNNQISITYYPNPASDLINFEIELSRNQCGDLFWRLGLVRRNQPHLPRFGNGARAVMHIQFEISIGK